MAAINLTAGQHACSYRDDRSMHKDDKRHIGDGIIADDSKFERIDAILDDDDVA